MLYMPSGASGWTVEMVDNKIEYTSSIILIWTLLSNVFVNVVFIIMFQCFKAIKCPKQEMLAKSLQHSKMIMSICRKE